MVYSLEHIPEIVDIILAKTKNVRFFLLHGDLGSGKTTLLRSVFEEMGIKEPVTSPTFTYVNIYYSPLLEKKIYHFDLYRLITLDEFYALALDESFEDQNTLIFIEWPELISPVIQKSFNFCEIFLYHTKEENTREVIIKQK